MLHLSSTRNFGKVKVTLSYNWAVRIDWHLIPFRNSLDCFGKTLNVSWFTVMKTGSTKKHDDMTPTSNQTGIRIFSKPVTISDHYGVCQGSSWMNWGVGQAERIVLDSTTCYSTSHSVAKRMRFYISIKYCITAECRERTEGFFPLRSARKMLAG